MIKRDQDRQREKTLKKEIKFMDVSIVGIFIFLFVFTCAMAYLTYSTSVEADTLIISVFGFCGLECGLMAGITKRKTTVRSELDKLLKKDNNNQKRLDYQQTPSVSDTAAKQTSIPHQDKNIVDDNKEEDDIEYQTPIIY